MASRRKNRKKSTRKRVANTSSSNTQAQLKTVEWPGNIDYKYVQDARDRLNVIEQSRVSDDMIMAFLAANDMRQRDAVEALKKTVEWRNGRQMFWNNYRSQNERYQFLQQTRKCGKGTGSTYGHTINGRLVFYEKVGENFSVPLHKEFSVPELIDHVIVWCENLLNSAFANAGKSVDLIQKIPFYENEKEEDIDNESEEYKRSFKALPTETNTTYTDVIGIIDWDGMNESIFIENKELLVACAQLLSSYYPHLINTLYHINMPLNFEKIENELKKSNSIPAQVIYKSIFLESAESQKNRANYMKRNKYKASDPSVVNIGPNIDKYASEQLLKVISSGLLPKEYGGTCDTYTVFTYVDSLFRNLVGMSSEEQDMDEESESKSEEWEGKALRSAERHTIRMQVKRGEHYTWEFMAEYDRELWFGVTFEADGFRGKSIKIIVRNEMKQKCGYCPMFGDFIVLKAGNLIFQFRNIKGGKRLNLQYKIQTNTFPKYFIDQHLPNYDAEEKLLQTKTLNIGGKHSKKYIK